VERSGEADLDEGWAVALAQGVGMAIGAIAGEDELVDANLPDGAW
jgi:hypothetical protein